MKNNTVVYRKIAARGMAQSSINSPNERVRTLNDEELVSYDFKE